jgi:hypothetical protein
MLTRSTSTPIIRRPSLERPPQLPPPPCQKTPEAQPPQTQHGASPGMRSGQYRLVFETTQRRHSDPLPRQHQAPFREKSNSDRPPAQDPPTPNRWKNFYLDTDAVKALRLGQTATFLNQLRQGDDAGGFLACGLNHLDIIDSLVELCREQGVSAQQASALKQNIQGVRSPLQGLNKDHHLAHRLAGATAATLGGLAPLALAVPVGLKQLKLLAQQIALYTKTALYTAGAIRNPNSNTTTWIDLLITRHALIGVQSLLYAGVAFSRKVAVQELKDKFWFNATVTLIAGAVLALSYYKNKVGAAAVKLKKAIQPSVQNEEPGELTEQATQALSAIIDLAAHDQSALIKARADFEGFVHETTQCQTSHALTQYQNLLKNVTALLHPDEQAVAAPPVNNPDHIPKRALEVVAALATFGATALAMPDYALVVDDLIDAIFVTSVMDMMARNPTKTMEDACAEFENFVGMSVVSIPFFAIDHIHPFFNPIPKDTNPKDIAAMAKAAAKNLSSVGFIAGTSTMTLANATLPAHMGKWVSTATQAATRVARRRAARPIEHHEAPSVVDQV